MVSCSGDFVQNNEQH